MTPINNKQKKGISVVLTTLIIVIASVILGTAVTLFGTSLFQTGAQNQGISVTNAHMWFQSNATAPQVEGAFVVRNTGDKLVAVDTINIRGQIVPYNNWVASATGLSSTFTTAQFIWRQAVPATGTYLLDGTASTSTTLTQQTGPVSLDPGKYLVVYFSLPASSTVISSADIGASTTLDVRAGQISSVQSISVAHA